MIEISIIIPVRNQIQTLSMALESLKRQIKHPRQFEIVICDDGSTDGTGDMLKRLRYPIFFKYFYNNPPAGRSINRNLGAERSAGGTLIFFDGDMVPSDGYINAILANIGSTIVSTGDVKPPINAKIGPLDKYLYSRGRHSIASQGHDLPGRYFTSNNFSIDRGLFLKTGGFDTNFIGWGGEDIDFGLRLKDLGVTIKNEPDAITFHHHQRTIGSLARDFYSFGENSFDYLIKKHPSFLGQLPTRYLGISGPASKSNIFYTAISRIAASSTFLRTAEFMVKHGGGLNWPDLMFDYILWGNLALGYRNRKHG
jgi:glycosyltransferase involved in cell wall biosynthesis